MSTVHSFSEYVDSPKPQADKSCPFPVFSAKELGSMVFPPIKWIVPDVLPEGATILAGRPKLGKSWMALEIALAVARGGYCLGDRLCPAGDTLYLAWKTTAAVSSPELIVFQLLVLNGGRNVSTFLLNGPVVMRAVPRQFGAGLHPNRTPDWLSLTCWQCSNLRAAPKRLVTNTITLL